MSYNVLSIPPFDRQLKRLAKKYPSLKNEFATLLESLEDEPLQATLLGDNCFKIRLSIASKNKGKSGGARVITCLYVADEELYLLSIYDKSEQTSLNDKEINELIKIVNEFKQ